MIVDEFLARTQERIPTVEEMMSLCDDLGIAFRMEDGKPMLRPCPECREEALVLAKLFRREPFRSSVLAARFKEIEPVEEEKKVGPTVPLGATLIVADVHANTGKSMKGPAYMWTYTGAEKWYYVSEFEVPAVVGEAS